MTNNQARNKLLSLSEEKYRDFSAGLTPGAQSVIGVRMPLIKAMAKEIAAGDYRQFLSAPYIMYHEERILYGLIIGYLKTDIQEVLMYLNEWLKCVDNWAVCDTCIMNLKIIGKPQNQAVAREYIVNKLKNNKLKNTQEPFVIRAMIVALFCYFNTPQYAQEIKGIFSSVKNDNYYVKMALAWGVCELLIKNYDVGIDLIKSGVLETWTHNKAIAKAVDSFRITQERKAELIKSKK